MTGSHFSGSNPAVHTGGQVSRNGLLWSVVLAGGEGVRLRPLVREVSGDERPKQYVSLLDSRSLLQQTIDRLGALTPPARTVVVTMRSHAAYITGALRELGYPRVLFQPEDRGTAAAVLLAAHWIRAHDPGATVVVTPADHLVLEEAHLTGHVGAVARFVQQHPEWLVLLGARPTEPETEYGWIQAGPRVGWTAEGPVYRILRFWEKPSAELAAVLYTSGCLWNTLVLVAGARALVAAGAECVPELNDRLGRLAAFFGTEHESWAMGQAYALAPSANFSQSVLQRGPGALAVSKLPAVTWCDLGSPGRVLRTVAALGLTPPWLVGALHGLKDAG
jgi:mannose-1-phosphate guanylyltransferase